MYLPVVLDGRDTWGYSSRVTSRLLDPSAIGMLLLGQSPPATLPAGRGALNCTSYSKKLRGGNLYGRNTRNPSAEC